MMELKLDDNDVKTVLLNWANGQFPGMFDECALDGYSYSRSATLTKSRPAPEPAPEEKAAA